MTLQFTYEHGNRHKHAAIKLPVNLQNPRLYRFERVQGLVDTGAEMTIVDMSLAARLGLKRIREQKVATADASQPARHYPVYVATVVIGDVFHETIEVVGLKRRNPNEILIGRDVINTWYMEIWGPTQQGVIRREPPSA